MAVAERSITEHTAYRSLRRTEGQSEGVDRPGNLVEHMLERTGLDDDKLVRDVEGTISVSMCLVLVTRVRVVYLLRAKGFHRLENRSGDSLDLSERYRKSSAEDS